MTPWLVFYSSSEYRETYRWGLVLQEVKAPSLEEALDGILSVTGNQEVAHGTTHVSSQNTSHHGGHVGRVGGQGDVPNALFVQVEGSVKVESRNEDREKEMYGISSKMRNQFRALAETKYW